MGTLERKGDIYLRVDGQNHPFMKLAGVKGLVLQATKRSTVFGKWGDLQKVDYQLGSSPFDVGYYDIEVGIIQEGSASAPEMVGVFVPRRINKRLVAEDLRKRFGPNTFLLTEFDWGSYIAAIEECARGNETLEIDLPKKEWSRLKKEKIVTLKPMLSEDAFRRLILMGGDEFERYYLLVARVGMCHRS